MLADVARSGGLVSNHQSLITLAVRHRSLAKERSFSLGLVASPQDCPGHNYRTNDGCRFSGASLVRTDRKQKLLLTAFLALVGALLLGDFDS